MLKRIVPALMLAVLARADVVYNVTIGTSPLIGHPAAPFALDLQLTDGGDTGDANNTVALSGFAFGTGGPSGSAMLFGGATGSLGSSVNMTDSSFFNEFTQNFNPGSTLSFQLKLSINPDSGGTPDEFSLAILDKSGFEIPTHGPGDALLIIDLASGGPIVSTFATDTSQSPPGGGPAIGIAAPQIVAVSNVPEPGYLPLMTGLLMGIAIARLRGGRRFFRLFAYAAILAGVFYRRPFE